MGRKRIIVGESEWGIDDRTVEAVVAQVRGSLANGMVAELELLDGAGRAVTVFLNGRVVPSVVVDLDADPKPSEISG